MRQAKLDASIVMVLVVVVVVVLVVVVVGILWNWTNRLELVLRLSRDRRSRDNRPTN